MMQAAGPCETEAVLLLVCCQDDRMHLHTLARICLFAQRSEILPQLRQAPDAAAMFDLIVTGEAQVLQGKKNT